MPFCASIRSVSYTHLDVYKRQEQDDEAVTNATDDLTVYGHTGAGDAL